MSRRNTSLICITMFIVISLIVWVVLRKGYIVSRRALTIGTIKAMSAALYAEVKDNPQLINIYSSTIEQEWQLLSNQVYDEVIESIELRYNLDAPKDWKPSMPLTDVWGKRFSVLYRRISGTTDFFIISAGPDGAYFTGDDIASDDISVIPKWE